MTRGLTSALLTALRAAKPEAIVLLTIETKDTPSHIRVCNQEQDVTFAGNTYTARGFGLDSIRIDGQETPTLEVTFADIDVFWDTWLDTTDFRRHRATLEIVTRDTMATAANVFSESFRITGRSRAPMEVMFRLEPLRGILNKVRRPQSMSRKEFPGLPNQPVGS